MQVEVTMNNYEEAINNKNNEFRKMPTNSSNRENIILSKINQPAVAKHNVNENQE